MDEVKRCFEEGLLTRTGPSLGLARKSVEQAESFLADARDMVKYKKERMGIIALYNAFFHAARSLLFKDGIKERSHFCVARYLEEKYANQKTIGKKFLNNLDLLRDMRHNAQYSLGEFLPEGNLKEMAGVCKEFISVVKKLLK